MSELNCGLAAAMALALRRWPNDELAALNNAISWQDDLPESNPAFALAVADKLVRPDGRWDGRDELTAALSIEINNRVDAGTFV